MTSRRRLLALTTLSLILNAGASAQVGHDPSGSPYRDLKWGQFLSVSAGRLLGAGGTLGVAPHHGNVIWVRHDFLADRTVGVSLGGGFSRADRNYVRLDQVTDRIQGPVDQDVYFAEGMFALNLTGSKTWHGLAPYAGLGLGFAVAQATPIDSTEYKFGTKFYLAPTAGVRIYLSRRLFVRAEARAMFWSLKYPEAYRSRDPDGFGPGLPLLVGQSIKEWTPAPTIHIGLGFAFRRPFF